MQPRSSDADLAQVGGNVSYWWKSRDYIETVRQRQTENAAWEDLCDLIPRWIAAEGGAPTAKDVDDFLTDERRA